MIWDELPYRDGRPAPSMKGMLDARGPGPATELRALRIGTPTIVSESDSLATVARALLEHGTSCAVLDEPPLRVVTERDLAAAWAAELLPADEVARVATSHPLWAPVTTSVAEAAALMIHEGIRHLVVLDTDGRPTGIVSMTELFTVLVQSQEPMAVYATFASFMTHASQQ